MADLDFNDEAARLKLIKHLKKHIGKLPPEWRTYAELMVAKMEDRQSFMNTKDLEIAAKEAMGQSASSRIAKRSKQGLKEFYDAINTPLGQRAQSYDTMRRNTAVPGYAPDETPQTHHKEGQKKYGQSRGNAVLRSNNPWQILIQETVERTRRGLSGGNLDFNAAMLIPEFHQGVSEGALANQGVHQFVDRIPLDGNATPEERINQSAFEQRAADDWAGKDGVVITDKGIESGVTRSSMLETMRKEGLVDPSNQSEVLGQLGEMTTTDQFKNVAEEFGLPYTEESIPPFKGFQYRMGLGGYGPEMFRFLKDKLKAGGGIGAAFATDGDAIAELIKGNPEEAAKQASIGYVAGSVIGEGTKRLASAAPATAPYLGAAGQVLAPAAAIDAGAKIGVAMRDNVAESTHVSGRGAGRQAFAPEEQELPDLSVQLDGVVGAAKWVGDKLYRLNESFR